MWSIASRTEGVLIVPQGTLSSKKTIFVYQTNMAFFVAPPARLELTTLRLGGVRSIQVSYGGICSIVPFIGEYVNESKKNFNAAGKFRSFFSF